MLRLNSSITWCHDFAGRSFIVGFGNNPPQRPHHRNAACTLTEAAAGSCPFLFSSPRPSPLVLHGALVGGPKAPDDSFIDNRMDYIATEVATDYNAFYTLATMAAIQLGESFWGAYPGNCQGLIPGVRF